MSELFIKIFNMSICASWLALAVMLLRLVWKKAPKWARVLLWGLVAVRLICPVSFESALSLIPSPEPIRPEIMLDPAPEIRTGIFLIDNAVNPIVMESAAAEPGTGANPLQIRIPVAASIWIAGLGAMVLYAAVSYLLLRGKVSAAIRLRDNIFRSERVDSPFVLGFCRPRIYIPFHLDEKTARYVTAHEQAHIDRRDHWWKLFGFLLLGVHWFNPIMWISYSLLCRDIELACDEKVIRTLDRENRADYTQALLTCSISRRGIAACPLAFGEVGIQERVKAVMQYKKPGFWIIAGVIVTCLAVAVCFLTDPPAPVEDPGPQQILASSEAENEEISRDKPVTAPAPEPSAPPAERSGGIGFGPAGAPLTDSMGSYRLYEGGELHLPYSIRCTGSIADQGIGILLFLDGQPQPYKTAENGNYQYLHTFYPESGEPCTADIFFTPVTGAAGDTLKLYAATVTDPGYTPEEGLKWPVHTDGSIISGTRLKFEATPDPADLGAVHAEIAALSASHREVHPSDILGWPDTDPTGNTRSRVSVLDVTGSSKPSFLTPLDNTPTLRYELWASNHGHYSLVIFIDHKPAFYEGSGMILMDTQPDSKTVLEAKLDLTGLRGAHTVYAVLIPRNYEAENMPTQAYLSCSESFYLLPEEIAP